MPELDSQRVDCPYCGEALELWFDSSGGAQTYVEDCAVCCRPMEVHLYEEQGRWRLEVHRDDD
jgi:sarcosine oxidase delta subunit